MSEPKINPRAHLDRTSSSGIHCDSFFARNISRMAGTNSRTNQGAPAARKPPRIQASTENPVTVRANKAANVTLRPRNAFQNQAKVKNESTFGSKYRGPAPSRSKRLILCRSRLNIVEMAHIRRLHLSTAPCPSSASNRNWWPILT